MKKIVWLFIRLAGACMCAGIMLFHLSYGKSVVSDPSDLRLENLDALNASAGYWECVPDVNQYCSSGNGLLFQGRRHPFPPHFPPPGGTTPDSRPVAEYRIIPDRRSQKHTRFLRSR